LDGIRSGGANIGVWSGGQSNLIVRGRGGGLQDCLLIRVGILWAIKALNGQMTTESRIPSQCFFFFFFLYVQFYRAQNLIYVTHSKMVCGLWVGFSHSPLLTNSCRVSGGL
jgi:hypothetical protein